MIRALLDTAERGAALVVTDRRWGAVLSASALGFGLFIGVAIGPGAAGTLAGGPQQLIALAPEDGEEEAEAVVEGSPGGGGTGASLGGEEASSLESFAPFAPLAAESAESSPIAEEKPADEPKPPASEEEAQAETTELTGTVVHANPAAGSYAISIEGGELVPVHAARLPKPGAKLSVEGSQLANGTFAEEGEREHEGEAKTASFRGVVTSVGVDPTVPTYTLSARGASLPISVAADPSGTLPALGAYASVTATIADDGALTETAIDVEPGEPSTYLDLAGIYGGLDPETGQLLLSSDDTRAGEADLALTVGPKIDTAKLKQGDSYLATAEVQPDGSLALTGIASDEHRRGADDSSSAQGDLKR